MVSRLVPSGVLAAAAGAALMVAASSGPSSAFTLSSPSLDQAVATANVQHVGPLGLLAPDLLEMGAGVIPTGALTGATGAPTITRGGVAGGPGTAASARW